MKLLALWRYCFTSTSVCDIYGVDFSMTRKKVSFFAIFLLFWINQSINIRFFSFVLERKIRFLLMREVWKLCYNLSESEPIGTYLQVTVLDKTDRDSCLNVKLNVGATTRKHAKYTSLTSKNTAKKVWPFCYCSTGLVCLFFVCLSVCFQFGSFCFPWRRGIEKK